MVYDLMHSSCQVYEMQDHEFDFKPSPAYILSMGWNKELKKT
jgi:hypothetical protein